MISIEAESTGARRVVLILHGQLLTESAEKLLRECSDWRRAGLAVLLVLTGVPFISHTGAQALARLAQTGVRIIGCSPWIADAPFEGPIDLNRTFGDIGPGSFPWGDGGAEDL